MTNVLIRRLSTKLLRGKPFVVPRCNTARTIQTISLVGVPFSEGQSRPGVEEGAEAIRKGGLLPTLKNLDVKVIDEGDITIDPPNAAEPPRASTPEGEISICNATKVAAVCQNVSKKVADCASKGNFCLVLGGDHSIAAGSISGLSSVSNNLGVIWVDAHLDFNSPLTSPSRNAHGMSAFLSTRSGQRNPPEFDWLKTKIFADNLVYIGIRDADPGEWVNLKKAGVKKVFTMRHVDRFGIGKIVEMTLDHLKPSKTRPIHLSFDIDVLNPDLASCTGTKVPGGLLLREAQYIGECLHDTNALVGMDVVELNPQLGTKDTLHSTLQTINAVVAATLGGDRSKVPQNYDRN